MRNVPHTIIATVSGDTSIPVDLLRGLKPKFPGLTAKSTVFIRREFRGQNRVADSPNYMRR